jgi:hypothetical protein
MLDHSNGIWLVSVGNLLIHQIDFFFRLFLILGLMMLWKLQMQPFQSAAHVANILRMNDCTQERR